MELQKNIKLGVFLFLLLLVFTVSISFVKIERDTDLSDRKIISTNDPEDFYEPNNNSTSAYNLISNEANWLSSISGTGAQWDEDWYVVFLDPGEERIYAELTFSHALGNIDMEVYQSDGTTLVARSDSWDDNEYFDVNAPWTGTFYIRIYGDNAGNGYNLYWEDLAPFIIDDNYEENDYFGDAYPLVSHDGQWLSSIYGPGMQQDEDYYEIYVPNGKEHLIIHLIVFQSYGYVDMELYDSSYSYLKGSYSGDHNDYIDFFVPTSGDYYYIRIYGDNGGNEYDLRWQSLNPSIIDDAYEPNNNFYDAHNLLSYEGWWLSSINGPGFQKNNDFYKIEIKPGFEYLRLALVFDQSLGNLQIDLYDNNQNSIPGGYYGQNNKYYDYNLPSSGTYYIKVNGDDAGNTYDLWYGTPVDIYDDPYEPNNDMSEAYDLRDDEQKWLRNVKGKAVQGDEDWFMIDITPGFEHLIVNLSITYGFGNIWFTIYDEWWGYIGNSYAESYGEHFDQLLYHGTYFIQISGDNSGIEYDLWWDDLRTDFRSDDYYEENDNHSSAYYLQENIWLSDINYYGLQYDDDWYEIFVYEEELQLGLAVIYDFQEGFVGVRIYDEDLVLITKNSTMKDNEFINYVLPSNGTYYIRIFGYDTGNVYDLWWKTEEYTPSQIRQIPGFDLVITIGAILGITIIIMIKQKRSRLIS
ncbi:MAG: hypothetical protein ACFE91_15455 [Promethearchaeota archaeon]